LERAEKHLLAMQAVVEYARMRRFCMSRTQCKGCPYHLTMGCASPTTEGLLFIVARVFEEYMITKDIVRGDSQE
jgi:hypothetical protein